jgi:hypothetical protein
VWGAEFINQKSLLTEFIPCRRSRFKYHSARMESVGPYNKVPIGISDRRISKSSEGNLLNKSIHVKRQEMGENKGQEPEWEESSVDYGSEGSQCIGSMVNNRGGVPYNTQKWLTTEKMNVEYEET